MAKLRYILEIIVIMLIGYNYFPSSSNFIIFLMKLCFFFVSLMILILLIEIIAEKMELYIIQNKDKWLLEVHDKYSDLKYDFLRGIIYSIFGFLEYHLVKNKRKTFFRVYSFIKYNKILSLFIVLIFSIGIAILGTLLKMVLF